MKTEITLQDLIDKVKADLFSPYTDTGKESKIVYPIFFVDEVELELHVDISYDIDAGIKVTIPQFIEASVGAGHETGAGHKITLRLSPILSREEMLMLIDERTMKGIKDASAMALRKGSAGGS